MGNLYVILKKYEIAEDFCKKAIILKDNFSEAYSNLGYAQLGLEKYQESIKNSQIAISLKINSNAYLNLGLALFKLNKYDEALEAYEKAIVINPNLEDAYLNIGVLFEHKKDYINSYKSYQKLIDINPQSSNAYLNYGVLLKMDNKIYEAIQYYNKAIEINSKFSEAYFNRAIAYKFINEIDLSLKDLLSCYLLDINFSNLIGYKLNIESTACNWINYKYGKKILISGISLKKPVASAFSPLTVIDNPQLLQSAAVVFTKSKSPRNQVLGDIEKRPRRSRIRIGFYSADLYYHPASIWLVEQLENCDKSKFELFAFCMKSVEDPMQQRLRVSFDHWIEVEKSSDIDIAKLSRQLEIDIALDLNGHTSDGRPGIFAARAAPIQMSHIGFPGTMGAEYIDYYLTDEFVVPEKTRQYFTEKIVYVPCAYTYDRLRQPSVEPLTRSQFGLPEGAFVFTCQNGCKKITPDAFDVWMDLLRTVPNSVLWLLEPHPTAVQNLRKEAMARGVQSERLFFTKRETVSKDQEMARISRYLASYKLADLFLDTWPYNAGTTAIDALLAGLPVITKSGESVVARQATSALQAIEMPELITTTPKEYRDLAVELATNPQKLKQIKEKIDQNRLTTALFDAVTNTRYIEAAYLEMYRLYQENQEPKLIKIYK